MEETLSAYQFTSVYENLGYDPGKLGCIMLNIVPEDLENRVNEVIEPTDAYTARNPEHCHISGIVAGEPHVTLLYGLLRTGTEMKKHVLEVLEGGKALPATVEVDHVGFFESQQDDEDYYCVVAHLVVSPELEEANARLKFLPHIDTFPGYKAHMTLAYIRKDEELRDNVVSYLDGVLAGRTFMTGDINYGDV